MPLLATIKVSMGCIKTVQTPCIALLDCLCQIGDTKIDSSRVDSTQVSLAYNQNHPI